MKLRNIQSILVVFAISFAVFTACNTVKTVEFKTPVDTTNKVITYQTKKTYNLKTLDLFVSNEFDGARLNGLKKENDSTAIVIINPENTPVNFSAYYAFNAWSNVSKTLYFKFQYPKGHKHRYTPKLKINDVWSIIDSENIYKNDSIVTIKVQLNKSPTTIAAQEIQSSKDVKVWYTNLINGKDYAHYSVFGKSTLGRELPILDIYRGDKKGKDIIVLLTRQHPPEVTGYYAYQSFIQNILNESELSTEFLSKYRVLAFPIMNPDGVDLGHWRHNANGVDTNRDWSVYNQPEIKQTVSYITKVLKKDNAKVILGLDFHSTYEDVFYTNKKREGTTLPNFIDNWFKELEANIPNYKVNEASGNSKKPVSKGYMLYGHDAVGITYEIGDATPQERIKLIGSVTAEQMMKILLQ